jgi:hypothetical protein
MTENRQRKIDAFLQSSEAMIMVETQSIERDFEDRFSEVLAQRRHYMAAPAAGMNGVSKAHLRRLVFREIQDLLDLLLEELFRDEALSFFQGENGVEDVSPDRRTPIGHRTFLSEIIANSGVVPEDFRTYLCRATRALNFGETQELFKAKPRSGPQKQYTNKILRCHAVIHVHYLWGLGEKKGNARRIVGDAYGHPPETIRKWEQTEDFSEFDLGKVACLCANRLGKRRKQQLDDNEAFYADPAAYDMIPYCGTDVLERDGKNYRSPVD